MKIAVLVYGRLNKCVEHYENIINTLGTEHQLDFFMSSDNSPESLVHDFIHHYKPLAYTNEPIVYDYNLSKYPGKRDETNIHNMTCHFINKNRVFSLLEEYIQRDTTISYDIVVSLRVDCVFTSKFVFNELEENTIYIPVGDDNWGINDKLAYGSLNVMKKYNSINARDLLEQKLSIPHPEGLHLANIRFHMLTIQRVDVFHQLDK